MTKEKLLALLAEEYICNGKCQDDITRNYVHCKNCTRLDDFLAGFKTGRQKTDEEMAVNWIRSQGWSEETLPSDEFWQMSQAFLAGLKAGRPQFHNLRKDPNDPAEG